MRMLKPSSLHFALTGPSKLVSEQMRELTPRHQAIAGQLLLFDVVNSVVRNREFRRKRTKDDGTDRLRSFRNGAGRLHWVGDRKNRRSAIGLLSQVTPICFTSRKISAGLSVIPKLCYSLFIINSPR